MAKGKFYGIFMLIFFDIFEKKLRRDRKMEKSHRENAFESYKLIKFYMFYLLEIISQLEEPCHS